MRASDLPLALRRKLLGDKPPQPARATTPSLEFNEGEDAFRFQIKAARLPKWEEQYQFDPMREFKADFAFLEFKILVEIYGGIHRPGGGAHSRPLKIIGDMRRQRKAARLGFFILPFTPDEVKKGVALAETEDILHHHGWRP